MLPVDEDDGLLVMTQGCSGGMGSSAQHSAASEMSKSTEYD